MPEKFIPLSEQLSKKDLELILEVNKKAVEIETAVAEQNEEIIALLTDSKTRQEQMDEKLDKLIKQSEETSRDLFKIQALFVSGLISLVIQVIQIFVKK